MMNALTMRWMVAGTLLIGGCASDPARKPPSGEAAGQVVFPDPSRSTLPEGDFVNLQNLRQIAPGATKHQVYRLLGAPHFNEGVFGVRTWNYLFNFRGNPPDSAITTCQYQLTFDARAHLIVAHWKPASCESVLVPPVPVAYATKMPEEPLRLSSDMLFEFDRSELTPAGKQQLSALLQQLHAASEVQDILIVGYTDRMGRASYNLELSRRRAMSVQRYLVAGGVSGNSIKVRAMGERNPLVECPRSRHALLIVCLAPNRRVELSGTARS